MYNLINENFKNYTFYEMLFITYKATDSTSLTSGNILQSNPSIPCFNVTVDEGHPEQAPLKATLTIPSLNSTKSIEPPSLSTAGRMYSFKASIICSSRSEVETLNLTVSPSFVSN